MVIGASAELRKGDGEGFGENDGGGVGVAKKRAKKGLHALEV